jgi:hypothetical protein
VMGRRVGRRMRLGRMLDRLMLNRGGLGMNSGLGPVPVRGLGPGLGSVLGLSGSLFVGWSAAAFTTGGVRCMVVVGRSPASAFTAAMMVVVITAERAG